MQAAAVTAWIMVHTFPQMLGGNFLTGVSDITIAAPARMYKSRPKINAHQPPWHRAGAGQRQKDSAQQALVRNWVEPCARRRGEAKAAGHGAIQDVRNGGAGEQRQRQEVAAVQDGRTTKGTRTSRRIVSRLAALIQRGILKRV